MKSHNISWSSLLLLVLLQSKNVSSDPDSAFYQKCGKPFSCGGAVTGVGYPFRGLDEPEYCAHPSLVLSCDSDSNATSIVIMGIEYRVLEIEPNAQTLTIAREDMMATGCPTEMVNTTLDYSVFDFATSFMNYTFFYGCDPDSPPDYLIRVSCGAYVHPGALGPGDSCNATVVVPGPVMAGGELNTAELEESLRRGFQIRWKIGSRDCSDCIASKGQCGYDLEKNGTVCYCAEPPYVADVCAVANNVPTPTQSPENTLSSNSKGMCSGLNCFCHLMSID